MTRLTNWEIALAVTADEERAGVRRPQTAAEAYGRDALTLLERGGNVEDIVLQTHIAVRFAGIALDWGYEVTA